MIYSINLTKIATKFPDLYRAFSEAYDRFDDMYSPTGEMGNMCRNIADTVSGRGEFTCPEPDEVDKYYMLADATKGIVEAFGTFHDIRVYPVVLDSETEFEFFFGVDDLSRLAELNDLLGEDAITGEYEETPDIYVGR